MKINKTTKYGGEKHFINDFWAEIGLDVGRYGTGNISGATFDGERISNRQAGKLLLTKVWITGEGKLEVRVQDNNIMSEQDIIDRLTPLVRDYILTEILPEGQ